MTSLEARSFGIEYPLQAGWLKKYSGRLLTKTVSEKISQGLGKRAAKQKKKSSGGLKLTLIGIDITNAQLQNKSEFSAKCNATILNSKFVRSNDFLMSYEWRKIRLQALMTHGSICQCCGASPKNGAVMNVDHIKPRSKFPELALDLSNLQVLCAECNHGKGNWSQNDFR